MDPTAGWTYANDPQAGSRIHQSSSHQQIEWPNSSRSRRRQFTPQLLERYYRKLPIDFNSPAAPQYHQQLHPAQPSPSPSISYPQSPSLSPSLGQPYKVPIIKDVGVSEYEDLVFHRLPFIFVMDASGRLSSVNLSIDPGNEYWDSLKPAAERFLRNSESFDYSNITVITMKDLLRKYGLNSTGKKTILIEKVKKVREVLTRLLNKELT